MPHPHPVVHFEILGRDQKLLEEFYKGVFNWEINPVMEGYSLVKPSSFVQSPPSIIRTCACSQPRLLSLVRYFVEFDSFE